jgi:pimeloyl-ACP methyl ester carboxylesterase
MLDLRSELRFIAPLLVGAGFRVVTLDQRGMGETSGPWPEYGSIPLARDMMALIRHLDAGPALIYGTSNGAAAGSISRPRHPNWCAAWSSWPRSSATASRTSRSG